MTGFPDDYASARARFLAAAAHANAAITTVAHPDAKAPDGGPLAVDLAWLGEASAPAVLLCVSGMHGFEGPAGSAVQSTWLESCSDGDLPDGVAVLFVHALNPWGFAWVSRLTENNVDLNRNFIDWSSAPPANPFYGRVRDLLRVKDLSPETLMRLMAAQQALAAEIGPAAAQVAVDFGQYQDPEGISYGGAGPEFGHRAIRDHVAPLLSKARHIGIVDLHTGVGAYGEVAFLPLYGPEDRVAAAWWGKDRVTAWKRAPIEAAIEADARLADLPVVKSGQMKHRLAALLPDARIDGAVVEFGTARDGEFASLVFVTLYERWLRFVDGSDRMDARHAAFRAMARGCFVPDDDAWRAMVEREGPRIVTEALAGLASAA